MENEKEAALPPAPGSAWSSEQHVIDYWLKHYVHPTLYLCTLCGNSGIIDTRQTAISGSGYKPGLAQFCICPNGQHRRSDALPNLQAEGRGSTTPTNTDHDQKS